MRTATVWYFSRDVADEIAARERDGWAVRQIVRWQTRKGEGRWVVVFEQKAVDDDLA